MISTVSVLLAETCSPAARGFPGASARAQKRRRKAAAAGAAPGAFAVGDLVEVTNDEDGLRGCWYASDKVLQLICLPSSLLWPVALCEGAPSLPQTKANSWPVPALP